MTVFQQALVFLAAAVVAVPLFKRLGLGSVLGYLAAGVAIGPWGLGAHRRRREHAALRRVRRGAAAVPHRPGAAALAPVGAAPLRVRPGQRPGAWSARLLLAGAGPALGLGRAAAARRRLRPVAVLHRLRAPAARREERAAHRARAAAFGILLFQDLAVIPLLALLPLLGAPDAPATEPALAHRAQGRRRCSSGVVFGGPLPAAPAVPAGGARRTARSSSPPPRCCWSWAPRSLVSGVGLSMALGAFLAGVLLADSRVSPRAGGGHRALQGPAAGPVLHRRRACR